MVHVILNQLNRIPGLAEGTRSLACSLTRLRFVQLENDTLNLSVSLDAEFQNLNL